MKPYIMIIIGIALLTSCRKSNTPSTESPDPALHVKVAPVVRQDMIDTVRIFGEIKLRQQASVASQFDGRLVDFSLLIGDRVKANKQIGTIIPPQREALLQVLDKLDATMRPIMEQQIKSIPLKSPITGIVLQVIHHTGDVVQKGEPIVTIGDLSRLDVHGDLPVQYLPLLRDLKTITVSFINYPHPPIALPIEAIAGAVDEAKQTVALRLRLANKTGEFRPGMQMQLIFPGAVHPAVLTIPRTALLDEEGVYSAFVLRKNKVQKRHLTVGILQDDRIEVLSGLKEGERVVTQKAYSLVDGMEVIVE